MPDRTELEKALAVLEAQRAILGDAVVDAAVAPIREQLAAQEQGEGQAGGALPAEAKQHYTRALALFEEMGAVPDAGRARAALSLYSATLGQ